MFFFFFNDTATTEIYTLSLHDALPIFVRASGGAHRALIRAGHRERRGEVGAHRAKDRRDPHDNRSEEHTSELQSHSDLVCRLLLEKKKRSGGIRRLLSRCLSAVVWCS